MLIRISLIVAISVTPAVASAHHSPAAAFVLDERTSITGTVVEYRFVNPHAIVILDVALEDGSVERWTAEGGTPSALVRDGWTGQELKAGDRVTIVGNPTRDGSRAINWQAIVLSEGRQLGGGNGLPSMVPTLERRWREHVASIADE
jgi:hypothetical protein